jgi:hypothetical protein
MKRREEIEKLLGGYAAGTLTPTEREELFAAAMDDQDLFDMLAEEQALKEILDDPEDRKFLRESLGDVTAAADAPERRPWWRLSFWPMAAGLATVAAGLAVFTVVGIQKTTQQAATPQVAASKAEQPASEPPKEVADARISAAAPPERARKAVTASQEPAPTMAKAVKDAPASPEQPKREADQKPAEVSSTDKQAAPSVPPPASQPVQVAAVERKEAPPAVAPAQPPAPAPATKTSAGPSASQLYQAQFRQTQMEQQTQMMRQQQQLSRFAAGELRGGGGRDQDTRAKRAASPPAGSASGRAATASPAAAAPPADASKAEEAEASGPIRNAGIRYQILRRNSQSQFVETRLDTRFEVDDEIVWSVEKNSGGIVTVLVQTPGSTALVPVGIASQTLFEARTQPFKLPKGTVEFVLMLTPSGVAQTPRADQGQVSESSGNSVYVVAPGVARSPVTARVRIAVN